MKDKVYEIEEKYLSPYAFKSIDTKGRAQPIEECRLRTPFQRDRDRIIHSKAFRRLKHKTQVFLSPEGDHYRTRLTHTLEVCQIARTVGRALSLNEDLIEAIALGHDLGHTPFGHSGERCLASLTNGEFSHNRQSIRVVTVLENLNLCAEVLDGILNHRMNDKPATLEGVVVSYADRIAYVNHDIDDGIRAGLILEQSLPKESLEILGQSHSKRIGNLVYDLVDNSLDKPTVSLSKPFETALGQLRTFMFDSLYTNPSAKGEEVKAERLLRELFSYFIKNPEKLPQTYINELELEKPETVVCDYIAAMTDGYAVKTFDEIFVPENWRI